MGPVGNVPWCSLVPRGIKTTKRRTRKKTNPMHPHQHLDLQCMFHLPFIRPFVFVSLACSGGIPATCSGGVDADSHWHGLAGGRGPISCRGHRIQRCRHRGVARGPLTPKGSTPPAPFCDLGLPTLARLALRRLGPLAEAPTWVSPQSFVGALNHIFLRSPSEAAHSTEVRSDFGFPSDHLQVVTTLDGLPPVPQPICPSKRGCFPIPRKPLDSQLRTVNDIF